MTLLVKGRVLALNGAKRGRSLSTSLMCSGDCTFQLIWSGYHNPVCIPDVRCIKNCVTYSKHFVCVCVGGVMYSGEYDVCNVTVSVHPHRANWKVCLACIGLVSHRSRVRFPPWPSKLFSLPGVDAYSEWHHKHRTVSTSEVYFHTKFQSGP
jgi:hypothetical protein